MDLSGIFEASFEGLEGEKTIFMMCLSNLAESFFQDENINKEIKQEFREYVSNSMKPILENEDINSDFIITLADNITKHMEEKLEKALEGPLNLRENYKTGLSKILSNQTPIFKLTNEIGELKNLQTLNLTFNSLTELPSGLGYCISLVNLNLSRNKLQTLPIEFNLLSNLEYISISENEFKEFPMILLSLPKLKAIDISQNQLTDIPEAIESMESLQKFTVYGNKDLDQSIIKRFTKK